MQRERVPARCDDDLRQRKPINNPVACFTAAILSSEFPSIQRGGSVGDGASQDPGFVNRINRCITSMLSIISTLSFLCTTLQFVYSTFIHVSFSHSFNFFVLITCRLFKSWQEGAAHLLLLLFLPALAEAEDLSTTRISMTISAWDGTLKLIVVMTFQNRTTSLFGDHPGTLWASGHQTIPSCQQLDNKSRQLNQLLRLRNPNILSVSRNILPRRRRMNMSMRHWQPRRYPIKRLNDWIRPRMNLLTRGRIRTKLVSNWFHANLEICGDMSPLFTTWLASLLAQNTTPTQPSQAFRRRSWHVYSLVLSIMWCLWIPLPWMRWRPPRFVVGSMMKLPGLIQPRETETLHVPTFQW